MTIDGITWALTEDLPTVATFGVAILVALAIVLLAFDFRRGGRAAWPTFFTGVVGVLLLGAAVLRPVTVQTRGQLAGAPVTVLVDASRRLDLPTGDGQTRRTRADEAVERLQKHFERSRVDVERFGDELSDLTAALEALASRPGERPRAVVVVSDGRLSRPVPPITEESMRRVSGALPLNTVSVARENLLDASVRAVRSTGTAVAHQSFSLDVRVGCDPRLECAKIPVVVRELLDGEPSAILATGVADASEGEGTIELEVTLERAGPRIVEVSIDAPSGDVVPENDSRLITYHVARDRVRLLHVAGRPTYDVRALRMFLKADESIDLVAFFILRTTQDHTGVRDDSELALIPFPVEELFTEHLPSFDAVILQDIDAVEYQLQRHFPALNHYVREGGGLIVVGGPSSFSGGGYADTLLEDVLPVELDAGEEPYDRGRFVPRYTEAGRAAPIMSGLRDLLDDRLPEMTGSNTLGAPRPSSIVLLDHPTRTVAGGPMPVLAVSEVGDGRTIALGVDGSHELAFSDLAAEVSGRGYGALWEGLLGWLMRDPRYEVAKMELDGPCIAGRDTKLELLPLPGMAGDPELELRRMGLPEGADGGEWPKKLKPSRSEGRTHVFELGKLTSGGYSARATIGEAPPTRFVFPCEAGGVAWSDSRPDPERLRAIADVTGGKAVTVDQIESIPEPKATVVAAERRTASVLPPWGWTLLAAAAMAAHWLLRRAGGFA